MAAILGGDTLTELRREPVRIAESDPGGAAPASRPVRRRPGICCALAQRAGLALPVVDLDRATVRYAPTSLRS